MIVSDTIFIFIYEKLNENIEMEKSSSTNEISIEMELVQ